MKAKIKKILQAKAKQVTESTIITHTRYHCNYCGEEAELCDICNDYLYEDNEIMCIKEKYHVHLNCYNDLKKTMITKKIRKKKDTSYRCPECDSKLEDVGNYKWGCPKDCIEPAEIWQIYGEENEDEDT